MKKSDNFVIPLFLAVVVASQFMSCNMPEGAGNENAQPSIGAIPEQTAYVGTTYYINLATYVSDDIQAPFELTYEITDGPGTMDGPIYSVLFSEPQEIVVQFTVTDTEGESASGQVEIDVLSGSGEQLSFPVNYVFVSGSGSDSVLSGDIDAPYSSLGFALQQAEIGGKAAVVVACGVYIENVIIPDGIHLLGGYDPGFTRHNVDTLKAVIHADGTEPYTILANDISTPTMVEGFIVEGPHVFDAGQSSSAIRLVDCTSALEISHVIVFAGSGGNGAAGGDGPNGISGPDGEPGHDAYETNTQNLATCEELGATPVPGGAGGVLIYALTNISGGNGADAHCPNSNDQQHSGDSGQGTAPGTGGLGGHDVFDSPPPSCHLFYTGGYSVSGYNGSDGTAGSDGTGGSGGLESGWTIVTNVMVSEAGNPGTDGQPGSGGGGGGAGGGTDIALGCSYHDTLGPSGGGGGAGATPGTGGQGGSGGGNVFGIFVHTTHTPVSFPDITGCTVYCGVAGNGGDGGFGGIGGTGGAGTTGGRSGIEPPTGTAGDGGNGGAGGHGGGGGGGAGGHSIGIFVTLATASDPSYRMSNIVIMNFGTAGFGGAGGRSIASTGNDGENGTVVDVLTNL